MHSNKGHPESSEHGKAIIESPALAQDMINDHVRTGRRDPSNCTVEPEHQTLVDCKRLTVRLTVADRLAQLQIEVVDAHPDPNVVQGGL